MTPITFCINTYLNEKEYITLLLESLLNGIDVNRHHILIFVDGDNQNTTEMLINQHSLFPNLKIIKNNGPPIKYQKNINYMFQIAETDIVSYLQSDQVVCLKYDEAILSHLTKNMILSATRIEPPLHCLHDNPVTYVRNFGLTPADFNYTDFLASSELFKNKTKLTNYFFAPFTLYKNLWNDVGGHDCQFVKSREDSDILIRLLLNGNEVVQCWDAIAYHFTCISSRGIDWWKQDNKEKETIRLQNDAIELQRFIKKWGRFAHPTSYKEVQDLDKSKIIVNNPPIDTSKFEVL